MTKQDTNRPTRRRVLRTSGATLATVGTAGLVSTGAAAQSTGTLDGGVLADGFDVEPDRQAFIRGLLGGISNQFALYDPVDELVGEAQNEFNANEEGWLSYGNWLLGETGFGSPGTTIVNVDFGISRLPFREPDDLVETHVYAEHDDAAGEFVTLEWNDEFHDDAHYQVGLRNQGVLDAGDDLMAFNDTYIGDGPDEHEIPDDEYLNELAGKYAASIRAGENAMSILDVLLGDSNG